MALSINYNGSNIVYDESENVSLHLNTAGTYLEDNIDIDAYVNVNTAFAPAITLASSTGVITGTNTFTSGYYAASTETSTLNLTTKAAATYNTSTADQTIASNRWLTGVQTIKSVTTSNLTAANIAEGVVVKVGDANNASRITQVTGTHSGATSYTATISGSGNSSYCYVTFDGTKYYTNGDTFSFKAGQTLTIYCRGNNVQVNGDTVTLSNYSYTYTLPVGDVTINLSYSSSTSNNIRIWGLIRPTGTLSITAAGTHNVYKYSVASVPEATIEGISDNIFTTVDGQRKWLNNAYISVSPGGWLETDNYGAVYSYYNAVTAGTSITPTETAQIIGGANYMMEGAVTVNAISSTYVGSGVPDGNTRYY